MKRYLCLLLILVSCASTVPERKWAIGTAAADVAITVSATRHGATEISPLYGPHPSVTKLVAINTLLLGMVWLATKDMDVDSQRFVWRWIAVLRLGACAWNASQMRR